jgi:hypothetical protein
MIERNFVAILRQLKAADVDFVVVGGLAAVLNGAPVDTFDVDLVHSRDPANISRLLPQLTELDAILRIPPERQLRPELSHLADPGPLNLITRYGPLDLLGTIGSGLGFEDLLPHSLEMKIAAETSVNVLDLATLIALKEESMGEKDRITLPVLRRTLEEKRRKEDTLRNKD